MDRVSRIFASFKWPYGDKDPQASAVLAGRIAEVGRREELITYSDLVRGVTFRLPNVHDGRPFQIQPDDWTELHRALIGDFLGYISSESYARGRILASALVVSKAEWRPGSGFVQLAELLGLLQSRDELSVTSFWLEEVRKAHRWYVGGGN